MNILKNVGSIWKILVCLFSYSIFAQDISRIYYYKNVLEDTTIQNQLRLNTQWDEYAPLPIFGEKYMIFQSQRPGPYEEHSLWYSFNKNYHDPTSEPEWSDPLPLVFPLDNQPTKTMKVLNQEEFTINSDSFVGHSSVLIENNQIKEIYFTSTRNGQLEGYDRLNIYVANFINGRWSKVEHLNEINSNFDDLMPFITKDGKKLFFVSNRPGGYGGYDIWYAERDLNTGKWSKPVNLGPTVNTPYDEITPFLTINQQKLIFASNRPGGLGQFDLYVSNFNGLDFDQPLNLGEPFNSPQNDEALKITDNSLWTYFASDRIHVNAKGGYDIYKRKKKENNKEKTNKK
jgi:peptidoglycan-associated lipoprotein